MVDTEAHFLTEADCRVCHDSGVPGRHHNLYGEEIPSGSLVPDPDVDGDGVPDTNYSCLSCHQFDGNEDSGFTLYRDCFQCHSDSPHHTTPDAVNRQCNECHGDFVANFDDGHYIPTYAASEVTPWTGLHGEGWNNPAEASLPPEIGAPGDPYRESDGSGIVNDTDVLVLDTGKMYNFGDTMTRTDPAELRFKPGGTAKDDNDFMIDDPGRSGAYTYNVIFQQDPTLSAVWDPATDTLTVNIAPEQTAAELVQTINDAVAATDDGNGRVRATKLLTDGSGDLLPDTEYAPRGGDPLNNRGFGAGSCSYCHDHDGRLDENGDLDPLLIVDNHDTHHHAGLPFMVSNGAGGMTRRCNICHDYQDGAGSYHDQSGPAFDLHIRVCEECHGPESLHNIQADSPNAANPGTIVVGGEDPGYGHVGADGGPGASDCWGCHGFEFSSSSGAPFTGPVIPTVYTSDTATATAGEATSVILSGAAFTNDANGTSYESTVKLTAEDGTSVDLQPDILLDQGVLAVTIPADTAPGNYSLQAAKGDVTSNPTVISITPKVSISDISIRRGRATIYGAGFGGYAEGSGTEVNGTFVQRIGRRSRTYSMTGEVLSWTDTQITVRFPELPRTVTVESVFGSDRYVVVSN